MSDLRYLAQPSLTIDGQAAPSDLMQKIQQISVEESLHLPGMFTIVVINDYLPGSSNDQPWQYDNLLTIGKSIQIGFTSSITADTDFSQGETGTVLEGEITAIETHFTSQSQAPIIIRGYDVAHRLHRGRYNRSFQNMTDNDIVSKIAAEVGISLGTVEQTGGPYGYSDINEANGYIFQENQTNMEFLRQRAALNGFELFVQDGKLNFRKPQSQESLTLEWLKELQQFQVRVTSAQQVNNVEVHGWDYQNKQVLNSQKTSESVLTETEYGQGKSTSTAFQGQPNDPTMIVVDRPIFSSQQGDKIAQALFDELGGEFIYADAKCIGNPDLRPCKVVKLSGMGKYSGNYYVTETRHLYYQGGYSTEFSVRGLRGGDLLSSLSPSQRLLPGQTLLVGIVSNNQDPKGWGRVRVKLPTLTEEHESYWARVVSVGAGSSRGLDCLPEIDDEVLIAFEHGDINRPYVLGGVWNGQDAPPEKVEDSVVDGKVRLRTLKTRTGHMLQFVEEDKDDSRKGVYLKTVYGHELKCNDSDKVITLTTKNQDSLTLDDQNKKIELKTQAGHQLEMDDNSKTITMQSAGDIAIKAAGGKNITLEAGTIDLKGTSQITLTVGGNKITISSGSITAQSSGSMTVSGTSTTVKGSATTTVQGGTVTVSGISIKLG